MAPELSCFNFGQRGFLEPWLKKIGADLQSVPIDLDLDPAAVTLLCQTAAATCLQELGSALSIDAVALDACLQLVKRLWPITPVGAREFVGDDTWRRLLPLPWRDPQSALHNLESSAEAFKLWTAIVDLYASTFPDLSERDCELLAADSPVFAFLRGQTTSGSTERISFELLATYHKEQMADVLGAAVNFDCSVDIDPQNTLDPEDFDRRLRQALAPVVHAHRSRWPRPPTVSHEKLLATLIPANRLPEVALDPSLDPGNRAPETLLQRLFLCSYAAAQQVFGQPPGERGRNGALAELVQQVLMYYLFEFPEVDPSDLVELLPLNPLLVYLMMDAPILAEETDADTVGTMQRSRRSVESIPADRDWPSEPSEPAEVAVPCDAIGQTRVPAQATLLTVHPIVSGGEELLKELESLHDIQAGIQLIDTKKSQLDDHFFQSLEEEITRINTGGALGEFAMAHRYAVWRLHAAARYYYAQIVPNLECLGLPTVLAYAGDGTEVAKSLLMLGETSKHFGRFDLTLKCCDDGLRYDPAPELCLSIVRMRAEALTALGDVSGALAAWRELRELIPEPSETRRKYLVESYQGEARCHVAQCAFVDAESILSYANRTLGPTDFADPSLVALELSLARQCRVIADGILADMLLNPGYYSHVWDDYRVEAIWLSYFCNSRGACPWVDPALLPRSIECFQADFSRRLAAGLIDPYSPSDVMNTDVRVDGQIIPFRHFEQINNVLRSHGSRKRLVVQNMQCGSLNRSGGSDIICEFIYGDIDTDAEHIKMPLRSEDHPVILFLFKNETVICPTMTLEIAEFVGRDEFNAAWVAVREAHNQDTIRERLAWLAWEPDADDKDGDGDAK